MNTRDTRRAIHREVAGKLVSRIVRIRASFRTVVEAAKLPRSRAPPPLPFPRILPFRRPLEKSNPIICACHDGCSTSSTCEKGEMIHRCAAGNKTRYACACIATHVHRGPISVASHENPIGLLRLGRGWEEVRPMVMLPEQTTDFLVAITPAKFLNHLN